MTDRIEPALTPEQWQEVADYFAMHPHRDAAPFLDTIGLFTPESAIAALNAALPDSDPRKIMREWITDIRETVSIARGSIEAIQDAYGGHIMQAPLERLERVRRYANALESYLPPE